MSYQISKEYTNQNSKYRIYIKSEVGKIQLPSQYDNRNVMGFLQFICCSETCVGTLERDPVFFRLD